MWPFSRKQAASKQPAYSFQDDDREKSAVVRLERAVRKKRLEMHRARLERLHEQLEEQQMEEQIADLEDQLSEGEEESAQPQEMSADAMLLSLFTQVAKKPSQVAPAVVQPTQKASLSTAQLQEMRGRIPSHVLKTFKKMEPEQVVEQISMHYPDFLEAYDDDTIKRAVEVLRG